MLEKNYPVEQWIEEIGIDGKTTVPDIAKKYNVSRGIIHYWFKKRGFRIPNKWNGPELTELEKAWIAAVIDCEGTLTIGRPYNKERTSRQLMYACRVEMVGAGITKRLHELCGGTFMTERAKPGNRRPTSYWNITPFRLRWLLPQIIPYMLVKRRQAEIIVEILAKRRRGVGERYMSDDELLCLYRELRSLNKKGKVPEKW